MSLVTGGCVCVFVTIMIIIIMSPSLILYTKGWAAMTQLSILVALTRDGGKSLASHALRTPLALWLGKISMNLYLVHLPLLYYLAWIMNGGINTTPDAPLDCGSEGSPGYDSCSKQWADFIKVSE